MSFSTEAKKTKNRWSKIGGSALVVMALAFPFVDSHWQTTRHEVFLPHMSAVKVVQSNAVAAGIWTTPFSGEASYPHMLLVLGSHTTLALWRNLQQHNQFVYQRGQAYALARLLPVAHGRGVMISYRGHSAILRNFPASWDRNAFWIREKTGYQIEAIPKNGG